MIEALSHLWLVWPLCILAFVFILVGGAVLTNGQSKPKREWLTYAAVFVTGFVCLALAFAGLTHRDNVHYDQFKNRCHAAGGNIIVNSNQTCVKGKVLF